LRTEFHVFVNVADIEPRRLREVVTQAEVVPKRITKPDELLGVYSVTIADDLLGTERLRDLLRREGVESCVRPERVLSDEEILAAPLSVVRTEREHGFGGPAYGTEFSLESACSRCGTGARPIGDVIVKASDIPRRGDVFQTLIGEHFVSDRLRGELTRSGFTGAEFHEARSARKRERLPWSQLVAPHELPPVDPETSGGLKREDPCPVCDRDGYFGTAKSPLELRYSLSRAEVGDLPDFSSTWERFGLSKLAEPFEDSVFAHPLLVVTPRVVKLLKELKVRGLLFDPVQID
jgi:hypothetical protein